MEIYPWELHGDNAQYLYKPSLLEAINLPLVQTGLWGLVKLGFNNTELSVSYFHIKLIT